MKLVETLENGDRIIIEADDKAALHLQTGALDSAHAREHVAIFVLRFVALDQTRFIRRFDADEHGGKARFRHQGQQFRIIRQIQRDLGIEGEGIFARGHPRDDGGEELLLHPLFRADEIIVHEEDIPTPAEFIQALQLRQHLRGGFAARDAAKHGSDGAEIAIKGTAA